MATMQSWVLYEQVASTRDKDDDKNVLWLEKKKNDVLEQCKARAVQQHVNDERTTVIETDTRQCAQVHAYDFIAKMTMPTCTTTPITNTLSHVRCDDDDRQRPIDSNRFVVMMNVILKDNFENY